MDGLEEFAFDCAVHGRVEELFNFNRPARTKVLTGIFEPPILAEVMSSTRTFFFFAFTYRSFFFKESGPAKFENDVLKT